MYQQWPRCIDGLLINIFRVVKRDWISKLPFRLYAKDDESMIPQSIANDCSIRNEIIMQHTSSQKQIVETN